MVYFFKRGSFSWLLISLSPFSGPKPDGQTGLPLLLGHRQRPDQGIPDGPQVRPGAAAGPTGKPSGQRPRTADQQADGAGRHDRHGRGGRGHPGLRGPGGRGHRSGKEKLNKANLIFHFLSLSFCDK